MFKSGSVIHIIYFLLSRLSTANSLWYRTNRGTRKRYLPPRPPIVPLNFQIVDVINSLGKLLLLLWNENEANAQKVNLSSLQQNPKSHPQPYNRYPPVPLLNETLHPSMPSFFKIFYLSPLTGWCWVHFRYSPTQSIQHCPSEILTSSSTARSSRGLLAFSVSAHILFCKWRAMPPGIYVTYLSQET